MADQPEQTEILDRDFLPTQPAVTAAMRKRIAIAWAHDEMARDEEECRERENG